MSDENGVEEIGTTGASTRSMNERFIAAKNDTQEKLYAAHSTAKVEIEKAESKYCQDRIRVLSRVWILTQLCTFALIISGLAVSGIGGNPFYGFLAFQISVLAVFVSVAGAIILRKYRTSGYHGFLLGLSFMMANMMLMNGVVSGTRRHCDDQGSNTAQAALGAFSVFLFFLYLIFSIMLYKWREDIIAPMYDDEEELAGIELGEDVATESLNAGEREDEGGDLKMV